MRDRNFSICHSIAARNRRIHLGYLFRLSVFHMLEGQKFHCTNYDTHCFCSTAVTSFCMADYAAGMTQEAQEMVLTELTFQFTTLAFHSVEISAFSVGEFS